MTHADRVEAIGRRLAAHRGSSPISIKKRAVSHQVPKRSHGQTDDVIDVTDLDRILEIDVEKRTCTAEPGVTFVDLVRATLERGLVPTVVPELETITIGGAVSGCSLESMSFARGGFHDSCLEYEVVTANGDVLQCTPDNEHRLVFQMMHGSFGTLGVLTKLKFALVPAKRFVHVVYETYASWEAYRAAIMRRFDARDPKTSVDFMDGIIHSPSEFVLSLGTFVDEAPYTHRYDWMRVYYKSTHERDEDYLTTHDYLFRYDHGVTNVTPKSFVGRMLFGKFLDSAALLRLAQRMRRFLPERPRVTLDMFIPVSRVGEYLAWHDRELGFYPLWCVPYRRVRDYEWIANDYFEGMNDPLFIDLAIYGMKQRKGHDDYADIEAELLRLQGIKTLISYNRYDEKTFWRIWNAPNYAAVKKLVDPRNVFRDLYSKTCRAPLGLPDAPFQLA